MADVSKYEKMRAKAEAAGDSAAVAYFDSKIRQLSGEGPQPEGAPESSKSWWQNMGTGSGMLDQVAAGVNRGVVGALALPDTLGDLTTTGLAKIGAIDPATAEAVNARTPGYEKMLADYEALTGKLPEPETRAQKFVSDVSEFIPSAGAGGGIRTGAKMLAGSVGAGVGSTAAGDMAEGTMFETPARIAGAVIGHRVASPAAIGKSTLVREVGDPDAARKQVSKAADKKWNKVRAQDAAYTPDAIRKFVRDVKRDRGELLNPAFSPTAAKGARELLKAGNKVNKLEMPKRAIRDEAMKPAPVEGAGPDLKNVRSFNQRLKAVLENEPVTTRTGMSSAEFKKLQGDAREMSQRKILDTIIRDLEPAEGAYLGGVESGIRNRAGSYLRRAGDGLDPMMQKALADIVQREGVIGEGLLGQLGGRLGGHIMGAVGAGTHGLMGYLLAQGAHLAAREAGKVATMSAKQKARAVALAGRKARNKAAEMDKVWRKRRNLNTLLATERALQDSQED